MQGVRRDISLLSGHQRPVVRGGIYSQAAGVEALRVNLELDLLLLSVCVFSSPHTRIFAPKEGRHRCHRQVSSRCYEVDTVKRETGDQAVLGDRIPAKPVEEEILFTSPGIHLRNQKGYTLKETKNYT